MGCLLKKSKRGGPFLALYSVWQPIVSGETLPGCRKQLHLISCVQIYTLGSCCRNRFPPALSEVFRVHLHILSTFPFHPISLSPSHAILPFSPSYHLCSVPAHLKSLPFLFASLLFSMSGYSDLNTCLRIHAQHPYMKENTWMLSSQILVISLRMILLQLRGIGRDLVVIQTM